MMKYLFFFYIWLMYECVILSAAAVLAGLSPLIVATVTISSSFITIFTIRKIKYSLTEFSCGDTRKDLRAVTRTSLYLCTAFLLLLLFIVYRVSFIHIDSISNLRLVMPFGFYFIYVLSILMIMYTEYETRTHFNLIFVMVLSIIISSIIQIIYIGALGQLYGFDEQQYFGMFKKRFLFYGSVPQMYQPPVHYPLTLLDNLSFLQRMYDVLNPIGFFSFIYFITLIIPSVDPMYVFGITPVVLFNIYSFFFVFYAAFHTVASKSNTFSILAALLLLSVPLLPYIAGRSIPQTFSSVFFFGALFFTSMLFKKHDNYLLLGSLLSLLCALLSHYFVGSISLLIVLYGLLVKWTNSLKEKYSKLILLMISLSLGSLLLILFWISPLFFTFYTEPIGFVDNWFYYFLIFFFALPRPADRILDPYSPLHFVFHMFSLGSFVYSLRTSKVPCFLRYFSGVAFTLLLNYSLLKITNCFLCNLFANRILMYAYVLSVLLVVYFVRGIFRLERIAKEVKLIIRPLQCLVTVRLNQLLGILVVVFILCTLPANYYYTFESPSTAYAQFPFPISSKKDRPLLEMIHENSKNSNLNYVVVSDRHMLSLGASLYGICMNGSYYNARDPYVEAIYEAILKKRLDENLLRNSLSHWADQGYNFDIVYIIIRKGHLILLKKYDMESLSQYLDAASYLKAFYKDNEYLVYVYVATFNNSSS